MPQRHEGSKLFLVPLCLRGISYYFQNFCQVIYVFKGDINLVKDPCISSFFCFVIHLRHEDTKLFLVSLRFAL